MGNNSQTIFIGDKFTNKIGLTVEVIEYINSSNIIIKFIKTGYIAKSYYHGLRNGYFKDNLHPSLCGVGYFGKGEHSGSCKKHKCWTNMMLRCYYKTNKIDNDSSVCESWHDYQVFAKWYEENYVKSFQLDKDLKIYKNKIYSPDTCVFVPNKINSLFPVKISHNKNLAHGVKMRRTRFASQISDKTFSTELEAMKEYWNDKYKSVQDVIIDYPQFKVLINDYFEHFMNDNIKQELYNATR